MLRPDPDDDLPARQASGPVVGETEANAFGQHGDGAGLPRLDPSGQKVHRRRADEARDEGRRGGLVHVLGRAHLLDAPGVQHDDAVGERHGLDLIVRDVDRGRAHALAQLLDLGAHLHAQLRVEVGQGLVEQEHLGIAHDRPAHGDALALAARKLARLAPEQSLDVQNAGGLLTRCRISSLRTPRYWSENAMFSNTLMCG